MAKNFQRGVDTKISFGVMPPSLLDPTIPLAPPPDVTVTTTAGVAALDEDITVTALSGPIAPGSALLLIAGTAKLVVYTTAEAEQGATTIEILPAAAAIASGAVANHKGLILLTGGTNSQEQINNQGQQISIYQDETGSGFQDGIVTTANWMFTYNFNALPDDLGYYRLKYTALNAIKGVRGFVRKEDPIGPGITQGERIEGLADIEGWSVDNPADGIVAGNLTFAGRGNPISTPAVRA